MEIDEDVQQHGSSHVGEFPEDQENVAEDLHDAPPVEMDTGTSEESDSDSDVEFLMGAPNTSSSGSMTASTVQPRATIQGAAVAMLAPTQAGDEAKQPQGIATPTAATTGATKREMPAVDVDSVGEYNGRPITQIAMAEYDDKPWRKPGTDITDYFNYGFDEFTWQAYCSKQDRLRTDYTPQKAMGMMGMPPMFMPGMPGMPPMPGMPGMPGLPNMPSMPGMAMPGMPGMPGMPRGMPGMPNQNQFAPPFPNQQDKRG